MCLGFLRNIFLEKHILLEENFHTALHLETELYAKEKNCKGEKVYIYIQDKQYNALVGHSLYI